MTPAPVVYVAGPSSDTGRSWRVMRELERRGAVVAHDWVGEIRRLGGRLPEDADVRLECARADLLGVDRADAVLGLLGPPSVGRCHELGAALLRRVRGEAVRVLTAGPRPSPDIWDELCEHHDAALGAVRALTGALVNPVALVERACGALALALSSERWPPRDALADELDLALDLLRRHLPEAERDALEHARAVLQILLDRWSGGLRAADVEAARELCDAALARLERGCYLLAGD